MPLTQFQIEEIKKKALIKGYNDQQIASSIAGLNKSTATTQTSPVNTTSQSNQNGGIAGKTATDTKQEDQSGSGIVGNFFKSIFDMGANYTKFVGEAAVQGVRSAVDPTINSNIDISSKLSKKSDELFKQSQDLISQAKLATDPAEKIRLLDESRKIDLQIEQLGNSAREIGDKKTSFLVDEEKIADKGKIALTGAKATSGAASLVVPGGATVKTAAALGFASGALFGFSEGEDIDVNKIISGAVGGAIGGAVVTGVLPKVGEILGSGKDKVSVGFKKLWEKTETNLSDEAAQRINKSTPSSWQKALEDHGIDLNELTKKIVDKAKKVSGKEGVGYDDLIGTTSERGQGGILKSEIKTAEKSINQALKSSGSNTKFTINEMVEDLTREMKQLLKLPGNENNAAALKEFVKGFQAQYGKGITPKRLLELKRVADSKFGQAVADESTGSAVAQAQKMVANAARAKLKKLLPEVAEALDNETEIYTIQPVISRARAILNTQGSSIRVGSLSGKSLTELINPFTWVDWYLSDPERASKLIKTGIDGAKEESLKQFTQGNIPGLKSQLASRLVGTSVGLGVTNNGPQNNDQIGKTEDNSNYNGNQEQKSSNIDSKINHNDILPQPKPETVRPFGGKSKNELLQLAVAQGVGLKDLDEISKIYDLIVPDEKNIDTLLAKRKNLVDAGFSTAEIDKQLEGLGITKTQSGQQDLTTQINNISTAGERNGARAVKDIYDVVNTALTSAEKGAPTGPLSALGALFSKQYEPNETAQLEKDLKEILRTIRKESTGVAYSPQEIKDLENEIPTIVQQEGNVKDSLIRLKQRMLQKLGNYGVDVSGELKD